MLGCGGHFYVLAMGRDINVILSLGGYMRDRYEVYCTEFTNK